VGCALPLLGRQVGVNLWKCIVIRRLSHWRNSGLSSDTDLRLQYVSMSPLAHTWTKQQQHHQVFDCGSCCCWIHLVALAGWLLKKPHALHHLDNKTMISHLPLVQDTPASKWKGALMRQSSPKHKLTESPWGRSPPQSTVCKIAIAGSPSSASHPVFR